MGFAVIPYILQSGGGSNSRIVIPGSAAGGNDLVLSIGAVNKDVTIKRDGTLLDSKDFVEGLGLVGSLIKTQSFGLNTALVSTEYTLTAQTLEMVMVNLVAPETISGVGFMQCLNGGFTASNFNGIGLYSHDGSGTLTLIATSANDGNIWKNTSNSFVQVPFTSPIALNPGTYWVALLYNRSVETTAPKIAGGTQGVSSAVSIVALDLTNGGKTYSAGSGYTSLPSSTIFLAASARRHWVCLY